MKNKVDMWYRDIFVPQKYAADVRFSDCDCVYRGNIYDEKGKIIGDYESPDSCWLEKNFNITWKR